MMIVVDISAAVHQRAGLGRYSARLAEALLAADPSRFALFYNGAGKAQVPASLAAAPRHTVRLGYKPWRMAVLLGQAARLPFNRLVPGAKLFHSTEHLLMPLAGVPTVLTVHDLIFKLFPAYHKRLNYWYLNWAMPLFCRRAGHIVTVSQASKRDIVAHYGLDPARITVIYEAAAPGFRLPPPDEVARVRQQYGLPARFLLHLGTLEPRKNLDRLVTALQRLRRDFPDLCLVLAGGKGWLVEPFFARLEREGLAQVVRPLGWVPERDLPALIAAASLAVQPSLYEGFGLPLLEHMACGQTVAASNSSSFPEVGGQAVAYFDPLDVEEMAGVIRRLLLDPEECRHRAELGRQQAQQFSWQRAAQETMAVYDQLLD